MSVKSFYHPSGLASATSSYGPGFEFTRELRVERAKEKCFVLARVVHTGQASNKFKDAGAFILPTLHKIREDAKFRNEINGLLAYLQSTLQYNYKGKMYPWIFLVGLAYNDTQAEQFAMSLKESLASHLGDANAYEYTSTIVYNGLETTSEPVSLYENFHQDDVQKLLSKVSRMGKDGSASNPVNIL